ncbi:MAG TPA: hypothetical protein DEB05_12900 [Firmicutes bacterium]|jgi:uncharacterized membrane protein YkvI|nr:hypothetical protein [Bacillota bacterium]
MNRFTRVMIVALIYIGTVVGAGFASGQEIWYFFSRYQTKGTWGLLLSIIILGFLGAKAMEWGRRIGAESYRDFLKEVVGVSYGYLCDLMMTGFIFLLTGVMLAGSGAVATELGWGREVGCGATVILTILVLSKRLAGLKGANLVVVPLLFFTGLILNLYGKRMMAPMSGQPIPSGFWLVAALQYSAYNLVMALPILVNLYQIESDPEILKWGGRMGGLALGSLALLFHMLLSKYDFSSIDLPLFYLTQNWKQWWRYLFSFVLWGELFTTLIADAYGLVSRFNLQKSKNYLGKLFLMLILAVLVSRIGFAHLIKRFYPLFGFLSFTILMPLWLRPLPPLKEKQ